jgi:hypothetical protein
MNADRQDAPVATMPNQPSESLLERQDGEGHLVFTERVALSRPDRVDSGGGDGVAR